MQLKWELCLNPERVRRGLTFHLYVVAGPNGTHARVHFFFFKFKGKQFASANRVSGKSQVFEDLRGL